MRENRFVYKNVSYRRNEKKIQHFLPVESNMTVMAVEATLRKNYIPTTYICKSASSDRIGVLTTAIQISAVKW